MDGAAVTFITLGATFLLGLAADAIGRRTRLPRVTMLLILGFAIGPEGLDVLPAGHEDLFRRASEIALTMVGFLLGERLIHAASADGGRAVWMISITVVVVTAAVVFTGLRAMGLDTPTALLLAGIATATAPAATLDVVRQSGLQGRITDTLLGVVAVDDAWGLLGFSLLLAAARVIAGHDAGAWESAYGGLWEIAGSVGLGATLGIVMALLTARIEPGEPTFLEAIGFVFLACGLAIRLELSFILVAMVMGAMVARFARHHERPFHMIENIELPFMIVFFLLAGASLELATIREIGAWGLAYILLRITGRATGGWLGAWWAGESKQMRRGIGLALLPQAGVALGMALFAEQHFPDSGRRILQIAIGSTIFFELVGPVVTRAVLARLNHSVAGKASG